LKFVPLSISLAAKIYAVKIKMFQLLKLFVTVKSVAMMKGPGTDIRGGGRIGTEDG
jgi:hypothetical protein